MEKRKAALEEKRQRLLALKQKKEKEAELMREARKLQVGDLEAVSESDPIEAKKNRIAELRAKREKLQAMKSAAAAAEAADLVPTAGTGGRVRSSSGAGARRRSASGSREEQHSSSDSSNTAAFAALQKIIDGLNEKVQMRGALRDLTRTCLHF